MQIYLDDRFFHSTSSLFARIMSSLLSIPSDHHSKIKKHCADFIKTVCEKNLLSLKLIDCFIDWFYTNDYIYTDYSQFSKIGMNVLVRESVYIPDSIIAKIKNYQELREKGIAVAFLLTSNREAPSLKATVDELNRFMPWFVSSDDIESDPEYIVERLISLAEDAYDDCASFPEYVARIADLKNRSTLDQLHSINKKIEYSLRLLAQDISLPAEPEPLDSSERSRRILWQINRFEALVKTRSCMLQRRENLTNPHIIR